MEENREKELTKKERRALKREERDAAVNQEARRRKMKKTITAVSVLFIIVGAGAGLVTSSQRREQNLPGKFIPNTQGRTHIAVGAPHEPYNSNPPTSGPHYPEPVKAGVYDEPVADEYLVHNMEHGHVIVWYHCPPAPAQTPTSTQKLGESLRAGCPEAVSTLKTMVEKKFKAWKVVLVPRAALQTRFALTAWERLDAFDDFDRERVQRFVKAFRDKGPEATAE